MPTTNVYQFRHIGQECGPRRQPRAAISPWEKTKTEAELFVTGDGAWMTSLPRPLL